ncbi:MAG: hypothetical protein IPN39_03150 [Chitinophagaceae bacterium]|nr:hypothetical protein [Chitinophagaceae bacterium]
MTKTILVKKLLIQIAFLLLWLLSFSQVALSQKITQADLKKLRAKEDTLSEYSEYLNTDSLPEDRMIADSAFTKVLVRALQVKNSFYYPFDSVLGVSKLYAPDTSFRIITWNINFDDYYSRQKGSNTIPYYRWFAETFTPERRI